ncbi:uncharacterized protein LOC117344504 [Pecten maximus]|uniref:uncharacterized protein LOC117344504 n=1 Tax=Pecten maximus TaxID=6579 RepID=UPI0014589486|nr:uncharacterized protein LOC117344504 [Pecten maximus]
MDQHTPSVSQETDQHPPSVPQEMDQHTPSVPQEMDQHTPSVPQEMDQHTLSVLQETDQHPPSVPQEMDQRTLSVLQEMDQHTPSVPQEMDQHTSNIKQPTAVKVRPRWTTGHLFSFIQTRKESGRRDVSGMLLCMMMLLGSSTPQTSSCMDQDHSTYLRTCRKCDLSLSTCSTPEADPFIFKIFFSLN